jgi:transcriptional regulator with XRE-family HTH domain
VVFCGKGALKLLMKRTAYEQRYKYFLERLRQARKDAGLRQEDVRKHLKTYQTYVSKVESGERRLDVIELDELAKLYKKPLDYFIS